MFSGTVHNCFDSHVHWLFTGQQATRLLLSGLQSQEDVRALKVEKHNFQGEWLIGFGWDQNNWPGGEFPTRTILDEVFGNTPVSFSRTDGHATWTNTEGLRRAGLLNGPLPNIQGGKILVDGSGQPTGVLIDTAERVIHSLVPLPSSAEIRAYLIRGMSIFNQAGITHIRDLTCTREQWIEALHLDESGLLTMAVEVFFGAFEPEKFQSNLQAALEARRMKSAKNLQVKGVKLFYDGALGSEGALLSRCYCSGSGKGLCLLTDEQLEQAMRAVWNSNMELAVHVIGDEAASRVAQIADKVWQSGLEGRLNLEHVEMLRPETIALLKGKDVVCHMQPCHYNTDKRWLKDKLGELYQYVFPWRALQEAEIKFYFGSDSPIERSSLPDNKRALDDSGFDGIPRLLGEWLSHHSHSDGSWAPNTFTHFVDGRVASLVFRGENVV